MPHLLFLLSAQVAAPGATAYFRPTPYAQRSDSPFAAEIADGTVYLEDFEDGALNTPYVMATCAGVSDAARPSVDEDDGIVDGIGSGIAWWIGRSPICDFGVMEFTFVPDQFGQLPTFVGFVVIGPAGTLLPNGDIDLHIAADVFDQNANQLSNGTLFEMPDHLDGDSGSTFYSRFIGFTSDVGIARLTISGAERIDHLQYGFVSIPEPRIGLLAAVGLVAGLARRRR